MVALTLLVEPVGDQSEQGFTITAINRLTAGLVDRGQQDVRASQFFQSAPFGIAALDAEGRIANCNAAFMRMVLDGRRRRTCSRPKPCAAPPSPKSAAHIDAGLARGSRGPRQHPADRNHGRRAEAIHAPHLSCRRLRPCSGGAAAALYVIDATEQKALEGRVAQAQKMEAVGNLAGGIAHDFNNVLTAIIGFSDLLLQTHRPSDPAYRTSRTSSRPPTAPPSLVAGLLGFSRKQTQQVSVFNVGEVASDMMPVLKTQVGEKIDLKIQAERDLWYVRADSDQLYQVIFNLVRNARDAMPNGRQADDPHAQRHRAREPEDERRRRLYARRVRADRSCRHRHRHERRK